MNSTPAVERLVLILIALIVAGTLLANGEHITSKISERLTIAAKTK